MEIQATLTSFVEKIKVMFDFARIDAYLLDKKNDEGREAWLGDEQESSDWKQEGKGGYWTRIGWVLLVNDGCFLRYDEWGGSTPKPGEAKVFLTAKAAIEYRTKNRMKKAFLHLATLSVKDESEIGERRDKMVFLYPSFVKALKEAKVAIVQDGPGGNRHVALVEIENVLAKVKD